MNGHRFVASSVTNMRSQVKAEISAKLKLCKRQLDGLGPSRATRDLQYKYLLEIATQYQTVTSLALKAHYGANELFDTSPTLKLATAVVSRNAAFSDDVWQRGHTMAFVKNVELKENDSAPSPNIFASVGNSSPFPAKTPIFGTTSTGTATTSKNNTPSAKTRTITPDGSGDGPKSVRYERNHTDLEDITQEKSLIPLPRTSGIKQWLEEVYKSSRGFELGTFDASLLPIIWRKQSARWESLALGYVEDIVSLVHSFTVDLLAKICKDPRARQALHLFLLDHLTDRYKRSIDHTKFLLTVERSGTPMTMNHYFADNLEKR